MKKNWVDSTIMGGIFKIETSLRRQIRSIITDTIVDKYILYTKCYLHILGLAGN